MHSFSRLVLATALLSGVALSATALPQDGMVVKNLKIAGQENQDAEICPKLIGNGCELDDAMRFASGGVAPAEDPPPDDPSVVEPPRPRDEL